MSTPMALLLATLPPININNVYYHMMIVHPNSVPLPTNPITWEHRAWERKYDRAEYKRHQIYARVLAEVQERIKGKLVEEREEGGSRGGGRNVKGRGKGNWEGGREGNEGKGKGKVKEEKKGEGKKGEKKKGQDGRRNGMKKGGSGSRKIMTRSMTRKMIEGKK
ncbi:uncharacterized protein RCO7_01378 [Rhynchosporium graminicola]|uniref:Uncharacterized protein n=1 Tax=Rhynchosporium graminicola TaxID=2792576 RepID=A0A1E1JYP7_9HELO|nr:uncharacterized protein RCO7_01378 [Rhynchosporium commune]